MVAPGGVHGCSGGACMVALGGHAWLLPGGVCMVKEGGMCGEGDMHGKGGASVAKGGMRGGGACVAKGGMCGMHPLPRYGRSLSGR